MEKQKIDKQWYFKSGEISNGNMVDLPHDFSIIQARDPNTLSGASNGYFPGGVGTYEKHIYIPKEWNNKNVFVEFEGIYMNATVRFNNQILAQHPYGYTSFYCNLTPYLVYGKENKLHVTVNNSALPNTRWYSGSGIYRHVWLLIGGEAYIPPWGAFSSTISISPEKSVLSVKTQVESTVVKSSCITVRTELYTVDQCCVASDEKEIEVPGEGLAESIQSITVSPAVLWSLENPYLYILKSKLFQYGMMIDQTETKIGIRSISVDPENGLMLNSVPIKMKGGCVHHDCGLLGSAAYDRAEERKIELLKNSGFNAVRCAHNPPSPAFLDACDRLGMLVIDEAFDCWREGKNPNDYNLYFEDWWERDMASMVIRDRNHPSVIMWSTGNEIIERDGRSEGYLFARKLVDHIRMLDDTRPITNALCSIYPEPTVETVSLDGIAEHDDSDYWDKVTRKFVEPLDVVGYNYLLDRYTSDIEKYPDRIICGTETFPKDAFDYWNATINSSNIIGDFVWTAIDYLGEAGIGHVWYNNEKSLLGTYPWHQAYCGDIDICGFKRPQSFYRDCVWGLSKVPYIAVYKPEFYGKDADISRWGWPDVVSAWTWPGFEGKPIIVEVYSTSNEVELLLNGKLLGRKPSGSGNKYISIFETVYEAGELKAIAYENGKEISAAVIKTAGSPCAIRLLPDRTRITSEFGDLSYVKVEVLDADENVVHNAENKIFLTTSGAGTLVAAGTGDPVSEDSYINGYCSVYQGRALAIVRSNGFSGEIILTVSSEGMPPASASIFAE